MKFGFTIPNTVQVKALTQPFETDVTGPDQANIARRAQELGYDMIPSRNTSSYRTRTWS